MKNCRTLLAVVFVLVATAAPGAAAADAPGCSSIPVPGTPRCSRVLLPIASTGDRMPAPANQPPTAVPAQPSPTAGAPTVVPTRAPTNTPAATSTSTPVPTVTAAPIATPLPSPKADSVLVFVSGINTQLVAGGTDPNFGSMRAGLTADGWLPQNILTFGYDGGSMNAGQWVPAQYDCAATTRHLDSARYQLAQMLYIYSAAHPRAHYTLVGHSLGGLVAMLYMNSLYAAGTPPLWVDGVVTLDSPIQGVSDRKLEALYASTCPTGAYDAMADLHDLYQPANNWHGRWTAVANWATANGVRLRTLANWNDCLYFGALSGCEVAFGPLDNDDEASQAIDGYAWGWSIPIDTGWPIEGNRGRLNSAHRALLAFAPWSGYALSYVEWAAQAR